MLPAWFEPAMWLSPLTYFSRGVRAATGYPAPTVGPLDPLVGHLLVLVALTALFVTLGAVALPQTD
jgi:ABC-2 type transport system permease protein